MEKTNKEIKFVAVYARVSSSTQEKQETIDVQLLEVRRFAQENGYEIVKEYKDEGWSGDVLDRPELDKLRQDARKKLWDAVLAYDPDRIARRGSWQEIVIEDLLVSGIPTLFVTVPPPKSDEDIIFYKMRGVFTEFERMKIKERFRLGKVSRVTSGNVLVSEAPYGYTYIPNKGKRGDSEYICGHYEIEAREAKIVEDIFSWVADKNFTLRAVVRELHRLGIQPRKSKRGVWSTSTLSTLLRNETYIGTAYWGASFATVPQKPLKHDRYKKIIKSSRRMKSKDQWLSISVPSIISKDLFDRAGLQLKKNFEMSSRNKKNEYLLAGKIWCSCGCRRTGEGPDNGKYLYYRCNSRVHSFPLAPTCTEKGINGRIADDAVWEKVKSIMSSPELMQEQVNLWLENRKDGNTRDSTINIKLTQDEISKLQLREDRFADAYAKGVISLKKFEEYVTPLRKKINEFENQIFQANLEKTTKNEILLPNKDEVEVFAGKAIKHLENLSFPTKQAIVRQIINTVTSSHQTLQVYGTINLNNIYVFFPEYRHRRSPKRR